MWGLDLPEEAAVLSYLPLAHIYEVSRFISDVPIPRPHVNA